MDDYSSLPLFDRAPANRSTTSLAGAVDVAPRSRRQAEIIVEAVESAKVGLTRAEIAEITSLPLASVCGRVPSLLRSGRLVERGHRMSQFGSRAKILHGTRAQ